MGVNRQQLSILEYSHIHTMALSAEYFMLEVTLLSLLRYIFSRRVQVAQVCGLIRAFMCQNVAIRNLLAVREKEIECSCSPRMNPMPIK